MSLQEEILQLCKAILTFQKDVTIVKEQLFNIHIVTKKLLWNHIIGQTYPKASGQQIAVFFSKHGLKITAKDIELLVWQYSSYKDGTLNINDLWHIFKPLTIKFIDQINSVREKKASIAKFHEAPYKISDLLCVIMKKTIQFLRKCNQMKWNVVSAKSQQVVIQPCDAAHLQIYLNKKYPQMILKEFQLVFSHIIRSQMVCLKNFQEYFIPYKYKGGNMNPNFLRQDEVIQQIGGIQLIKYHAENVQYISKQTNKKPLYLHEAPKQKPLLSSSSKLDLMNTKSSLRNL